jgi:hypothetical protein
MSLTSIGQDTKSMWASGTGLKGSYSYSRLNNIEIGLGKGKMKSMREMIGANGFYGGFINLGYGFHDTNSVLSTKLSFEVATILFGSRISLSNYTDFHINQMTVLPEAGFSYSGIISIMYGYNVYLTANKLNLSRHSLSISFMPYWTDNKKE